jgi:ribose transport system permease protein
MASLLSPFLGLGFILAVFCAYDLLPDGQLDDFLRLFSVYNLKLIGAQTTGIAIGALGMTVVIVSGGIDLSPGSVIALVTVVTAVALRGVEVPFLAEGPVQLSPSFALLAGVLTGILAGVLNGLVITRLRIVPFIATLGMMSVARGAAKWLGKEQKVNAPETWLNDLLRLEKDAPWWYLPQGIVVLGVLALVLDLVLRYSVFGRHVFAIGSSESTATLCGIRVKGQKVAVYALGGFFVGLAGILQFSELSGVGDPTGAEGRELYIIAAVVIGGGSLTGGKGSVAGTLIGALTLGVLRNACSLYLLPTTVEEIAIGLIIVAAAAIDALKQSRRG